MSAAPPVDWPAAGSFYSSPDWYRFVDSDGLSEPFYGVRNGTGLLAHHTPDEPHPDYRIDKVLGVVEDRPRLLLGGRRGFCSPVVTEQNPTLAPLIADALTANPAAGDSWWWPHLPSPDVPAVLEAARALTGDEPGLHLVGADCIVDLASPDQDYESILPVSSRRTNWRREWQRFLDSGLQLRQVSIAEIVDVGAPLLQQVENKYGNTHTEEYLRTFLARQARYLSEAAVVQAIFDGSRMIGYSLSYRWQNELAVRLMGLDYRALRNAAEYAVLIFHGPARYAREHGLTTLHLGTEGYQAKCRRGARVRGLWAVAPATTTSETAIAERSRAIIAAMPAAEGPAFGEQVAAVSRLSRLSAVPAGGSA